MSLKRLINFSFDFSSIKSIQSNIQRNLSISRSKSRHKYSLQPSPSMRNKKEPNWFNSPDFWGKGGALAGWGMTGAAIYDAKNSSPESISMNMTGVLIIYSSLFARWAYIVNPQNLLLCSCHVSNILAQCNQMRRALEY